jgi:hypothetical protein
MIGKTCFTGNAKGVILSWAGGAAGKDVILFIVFF